jgi:hypothetical protein
MHDWEHVTSKRFAAIFRKTEVFVPDIAESKDGQARSPRYAHDARASKESLRS